MIYFQNPVTCTFSKKLAIKWSLKISPNLKRIAALRANTVNRQMDEKEQTSGPVVTGVGRP